MSRRILVAVDGCHNAEQALQEAIKLASELQAKLRIVHAVDTVNINLGNSLPEMIAADAEAWPADLIVICTHGRRGLSHLFLGSIAEGVLRVATKPVLLIRGKWLTRVSWSNKHQHSPYGTNRHRLK